MNAWQIKLRRLLLIRCILSATKTMDPVMIKRNFSRKQSNNRIRL